MPTTKIKIDLYIPKVWPESRFYARRNLGSLATHKWTIQESNLTAQNQWCEGWKTYSHKNEKGQADLSHWWADMPTFTLCWKLAHSRLAVYHVSYFLKETSSIQDSHLIRVHIVCFQEKSSLMCTWIIICRRMKHNERLHFQKKTKVAR